MELPLASGLVTMTNLHMNGFGLLVCDIRVGPRALGPMGSSTQEVIMWCVSPIDSARLYIVPLLYTISVTN